MPEPLRRRISFFPGDDEGVFCILSGGSFVRSMCLSCAGGFLFFLLFDLVRMVGVTNNPLRLLFLLLLAAVGGGAERNSWLRFGRSVTFSFAAKGERIGSSPALQVCAGLLAWPATAAASSDRWLVGRRGGLSSSSVRARAGDSSTCWQLLPSYWGPQAWRKQVFLSSSVRYGAGDDPRFWQLLLSSWVPQQWQKEDLAGLPSAEVAGDDHGDIAGCVRQYSLYRGVSCKKAGMYCMLA